MTCEWCEISPCECTDDETGEGYNALERLLDKVAMTEPSLAAVMGEDFKGGD